jgi:integrase
VLSQHGSNITALGKDPVSVLNFANCLFRRMPLSSSRHDVHSLPASQDWPQDDSHNSWTKKMGSRQGEAIGLQAKDLGMLRRRISVSRNAVKVGGVIVVGTPRSHHRRSVPFPRFLAPLLAQQCAGKVRDGLVFADKYGRHIKRTRVSEGSRSWFLTALSTAGLPKMTFHDLRHTAAWLAVSVGANVKAVQRMLGHASAAMTLDTYADLFDDDLNAVADRLNDAATFSRVVKRLSKPNPSG